MIIYLQTIEDPGDRAKFAELYERYRAYMLKIADEILKNPFDAEDALHNAFMKISEHLDKVADPSSSTARGFVAIIVERKAIDIYRQRSRFVSLETIENEIGLSIPPPEEDAGTMPFKTPAEVSACDYVEILSWVHYKRNSRYVWHEGPCG